MAISESENEDPWDAFGDDNDDNDDQENNQNDDGSDNEVAVRKEGSDTSYEAAADRVASHLAKTFFWNKKSIKLGIKRRVGIVLLLLHDDNNNINNNNAEKNENDDAMKQQEQETWETTLTARGFAVTLQVVMLKNKRNDDTMILRNKQDQPALDAMVFTWATATAKSAAMTTMTTDNKEKDFEKLLCCMQKTICPGGVLIAPISSSSSSLSCKATTTLNDDTTTTTSHLWDRDVWKIDEAEMLYEYPYPAFHQTDKDKICLWAITKYACPIQSTLPTCTWLPLHYSVQEERQRVAQATICLSAHEIGRSKMVESSIQQAVQALQEYGYCIISRLLANTTRDLPRIHAWSRAACEDLHEAACILKQRDDVDLYHPHESHYEPASYREMSMREDFRMDLRHGPRLSQLRGGGEGGEASISSGENNNGITRTNTTSQTAKNKNVDDIDNADENDGNLPWIVKATTPLPGAIPCNGQKNDTNDNDKFHAGYFLRGHVDILEIVRRTMNPTTPDPNVLSRGNFGRYNFSGSGPDGSFQNLRVSPVGAIISLPGSADQAIHADIPHLFEHVSCLPAHYINVFTPGIAAAPRVGQTALVHASHTLAFCARFMNDDKPNSSVSDNNTTDDGNNKKEKSSWKDFLVRPALDLGDVLLFDCRILHFGLANSSGGGVGGDNGATTTTIAATTDEGSSGVERPLLYTNMTQHWFHDPKNWQDQRPIFGG